MAEIAAPVPRTTRLPVLSKEPTPVLFLVWNMTAVEIAWARTLDVGIANSMRFASALHAEFEGL